MKLICAFHFLLETLAGSTDALTATPLVDTDVGTKPRIERIFGNTRPEPYLAHLRQQQTRWR